MLFEQKRDSIGTEITGIDTIISGLFFLLPLICTEFRNIGIFTAEVIKTLYILFGVSVILRGAYMIYKSNRNQYSHSDLLKDVENLNEITHPFSIVVIKDSFNEYANRFLLYYDVDWDCKFFFNYHTMQEDNEKNIVARLSNELKIDKNAITVDYITEKIQSKYSERDKVNKVYEHRIYYANISDFTELTKQKEFEIDGKQFCWMTMEEMKKDNRIQKINDDVVSLVNSVIV